MDLQQPHRPPWRLHARGQWWLDIALATGLLLPVAVTLQDGATSTVLALAQLVPLFWRRHHAVTVFTLVAAASAAQVLLINYPMWSQVAFPVATYSVARFASAVPAAIALAVGVCAAGVAAMDWFRVFTQPDNWSPVIVYTLFISAIVSAAWALGTLARTRRAYVDTLVERGEQIAREADQRAELATSAERARIAREMHDVVAHGLSVIVVQADGARYASASDPQVARATLETIAATGRESLTEMRRMLGLLRSGEETGWRPQPGLADLATLVDEARAGGADVEAVLPEGSSGSPGAPGHAAASVPDGVALTTYRVVQESLSNVRKHAGPAPRVAISVSVGRDVVIEIEDDGRGAATEAEVASPGLGLLGMRERVTVHGGWFEAGPRPGGGFRVAARLPL